MRATVLALAVTTVLAGSCSGEPASAPVPSTDASVIPSGSTVTDLDGSAFVPPPGTRFAGRDGVVIAVPEGWTTVPVPQCAPQPARTVTFTEPGLWPLSCPYSPTTPRDRGPTVRFDDSTNDVRSLRRDTSAYDLDGLEAFRFDTERHDGRYTSGVEVPGRLAVWVSARTERALDRLLGSLRRVPDPWVLVPTETSADIHPHAMDAKLRRAGFVVTYREETPAIEGLGYPGRFVRTDPPVGTPLAPGSAVTVYASEGDGDGYLGDRALRRHGWKVSSPSTFTPPVSRARACRLAGFDRCRSFRTALLRDVSLRGAPARTAWFAVRRVTGRCGSTNHVQVLDASTGERLARGVLFAPRSGACPADDPGE